MESAVITGVIVAGLIVLAIWKVRQRQIPDKDYNENLSDYNRECRLVKLDYRDGKITLEEAKDRLEGVGDKYGIPPERRTKSIGSVQVRKM